MDDKKIHMIGYAHIDPVWLWRWPEGAAEIKATFRSVLDRMNEYRGFTFSQTSASYYEWVEKNEPSMFEEIKRRVAQGRWALMGGWWVEPDTNIPSGESLARQALYSQRYFMEKFGRIARVGCCADSFGQSVMLPQLLLKSGMPYYIYMRGSETPQPSDKHLFIWEGTDGSQILAFRLALSYGGGKADVIPDKIKHTLAFMQEHDFGFMCFYGVGNHGGGPTITNIRDVLKYQDEMGCHAVSFSTPEKFFDEQAVVKYALPVVRGDLQYVSTGTYTGNSRLKALNRRSEQRLLTAEKMACLTTMLIEKTESHTELKKAWKRVLFNQFHDIICGVSIKEAHEDVYEWYGEALSIGGEVLNNALQKIAWSIETEGGVPARKCKEKSHEVMNPRLWEEDGRGVPMVVFNPLSWEVSTPIQIRTVGVKAVSDHDGKALATQIIRGSQINHDFDTTHSIFVGRIPAYGYRVYWLYQKARENQRSDNLLRCDVYGMENEFYRIIFSHDTGHIKSLIDKRTGGSIFKQASCVPVVVDETDANTWGGGNSYRNEVGIFMDAEVVAAESGPIRACTRVVSRYDKSELRQDFILHAGSDLIEVRVRLVWLQKHQMLKLSFPLAVEEPKAVFEIPYGTLERECNGEEKPAQNWVDVSGTGVGGEFGLTVITDCKYGYDVLDNDFRLTVLRSPIYADLSGTRDGYREFTDQGVHEFRYWLYPHNGSLDKAYATKRALECITEPAMIIESYHKGSLAQTCSAMEVDAYNIIVTTFKRAEDGAGYILRAYETTGVATEAQINLPLINRNWKGWFGQCEIKTLFIPDDATLPIEERNLLEYNVQEAPYGNH